jgi:glycosyltransferase involved in cell wall biosynthesis
LFLSPDGFLSLSAQVKSVSVIHDLNFEHFPDDLPWHIRKYYRYYFPRFARKATRIATVSEFSKNDISEIYHIDNQVIDVVYNGTGSIFKPLDAAQIKGVRAKYSNEMPYFLFVGTMHPRKNLVNLFKAFDLFKQSDNQNIKLLLSGARMWWTSEIENSYNQMKFQSDVIFTGRLSDEELARVTASALAVTYVSYFEGFGIPILEAFAAQVPVITSDITSMPEVAGDAALLIDPFDNQAIANAMHQIVNDETLRSNLIHKASVRSQMFSWQNTADLLWDCIEKTL